MYLLPLAGFFARQGDGPVCFFASIDFEEAGLLVTSVRTLVHAVNYLEGDAGWRAVLEPAVPGFLGPLLMLGGLVANRPPLAAVGYVGIYAAVFGGGGLLIGVVLRFTAVAAIRIAGGEPEPDLAVVIGPVGNNDDHHPNVDEIAMVIEVSDSTLTYDRGIKLRAYAGAAIPAYWIVNLVDRQVEVYGNPKPSRTGTPRFAKRSDYLPGQQVPVVFAGSTLGSIAVDAILPPG